MSILSAQRLGVFPKAIVATVVLWCALFAVSSQADERVRRIQEELRRRNLYFGEVDGRDTDEIHEALRRYQKRKGFPQTGDFHQDTLISLGIGPFGPAPAAALEQAPEVPILKSDFAREIGVTDREFLERLNAAESPAAIAEGPPVPPAGALPAPAGPSSITPPAASPSGPEAPSGLPPEKPGAPPANSAGTPRNPSNSSTILDPPAADIERFVREYLTACQTNDLRREMAFYADTMRYFDHGTVGRDFVEKDVRRYYTRWPHREYTLLSVKVTPRTDSPAEFVARFRIRYTVSSGKAHASGQTDNIFSVKSDGDGWKFTALQESRVRG